MQQTSLLGHLQELRRGEQAPHRVLPANEGLHRDRPPGPQVAQRLVVHHEFVFVEGGAQLLQHREPVPARSVQVSGVQLAGAAPRLRLVHGDVAAAQQLAGGCRVRRVQNGTDAGADVHPGVLHPERAVEGRPEPLREPQRRRAVTAVRGEERELVTAEAGEQVVAAHAVPEPAGHLDQQLVPRLVAEGVVDLLEAVKVDHQQGAGAARRRPCARARNAAGGGWAARSGRRCAPRYGFR